MAGGHEGKQVLRGVPRIRSVQGSQFDSRGGGGGGGGGGVLYLLGVEGVDLLQQLRL